MEKTITVRYNESPLIVFATVAEKLGLRSGERILTEVRFWEVLGANAEYGIYLCEKELKNQ